jgi:hypothetical protein
MSAETAHDAVVKLNQAYGYVSSDAVMDASPRKVGLLESWAKWTWYIALSGYGTVFVLFFGAMLTMRRWLWLLTVGAFDAIAASFILAQYYQGSITFGWVVPISVLSLAPAMLILLIWQWERRMRTRQHPDQSRRSEGS